jgi:glycerol-3-phosphate dehydrogenase (NAD(P)+)
VTAVAVLGAGAWGTALALAALRTGAATTLVARSPERMAALAGDRENRLRLPGVALPADLALGADPLAVADGRPLIVACPFAHLAATLAPLAGLAPAGTPIAVATKGLDPEGLDGAASVVTRLLPTARVAALSGPSFAGEVAIGLPTALALAGPDPAGLAAIQAVLAQPTLRLYPTDDRLGVEFGGAVKNVLAIACGVADGRALGRNAVAALVTRGLAEMTRLGLAIGARPETLVGLAGLGDLVLTCAGGPSRNHAFGRALGQGFDPARAAVAAGGVVEGAAGARAVTRLARRHGVATPVADAVDGILHRGVTVARAIADLLARPMPGPAAREA